MQPARRVLTRRAPFTTPTLTPLTKRHFSPSPAQYDQSSQNEASQVFAGSSQSKLYELYEGFNAQARKSPKHSKNRSHASPEHASKPLILDGAKKVAGVSSSWPGLGDAADVYHTDNALTFVNEMKNNGHTYTIEQLRDACACVVCRDVDSGQKSFSTPEIRTDMKIRDVQAKDDGGLVVKVDKDIQRIGGEKGHEVVLSPDFVSKLSSPARAKQNDSISKQSYRYHVDYWDNTYIQQNVRKIDYQEFMEPSSTAFWDVIQDIMRLGIVFLKNVPRDEQSVVRIAERITCIQETFYGRTFDVRAKPNAENVAYTSGYLGLHQDLLYLDPMPFIQILHCMDNNCEGGESLFSDADRVGRILLSLPEEYRQVVAQLIKVHVPYAYHLHGHSYSQGRPVLQTRWNDDKKHRKSSRSFESVRWSPPFQGKFSKQTPLRTWIAAARVFERAVNHPSAVYKTKMAPGECVLFNNQRVLHGRTAFDSAGGSRWLRGTYLSQQDFWSKASHAPATHAAAPEDWAGRWDAEKAEAELQTTDMAGLIKEWLDKEKVSL